MVEPAAFSAVRSTARIFSLRVTMSLNVSVPDWLRLMRASSSSSALFSSAFRKRHLQAFGADRFDHEIDRARAHGRDHVVDAAVGGLHDHRNGVAGLAQPRQHAEAIEIGHDQIEHDAIEALAAGQQGGRRFAAVGNDRLVAELAHHVVEQAALNRIVIDNENSRGHGNTPNAKPMATVPFRGNLRLRP